jgi:glutaredoxin
MGRAKRIKVFTTPTCPYCVHAKRYLDEHELPYTEIDVTTDRKGLKEMVMMTGQYGVPVITVGERAMLGWNEREFKKLLAGEVR